MILLLGGTGYIGSAFAKKLTDHSIEHRVISRSHCDYTRRDRLEELLKDARPDFLINAAGYAGKPNVEACEKNKAECLSANAVLPGVIREACDAFQVPWGHVSSGCIYNGTRNGGGGFNENDPPNFCFRSPPCSFYAGSKALGEECLEGAEAVYIWRLRIPFESQDGPRNYLSKLMRYDRLLDVENSLADLGEFVDASLSCWQQQLPYGTYNVVNTGTITTREIVALIEEHLHPKREFRFFRDEDEFMRTATDVPRSSCVLDNSKLLAAGVPMSDVRNALERALKNWKAG